eukprot:CFRG4620T1
MFFNIKISKESFCGSTKGLSRQIRESVVYTAFEHTESPCQFDTNLVIMSLSKFVSLLAVVATSTYGAVVLDAVTDGSNGVPHLTLQELKNPPAHIKGVNVAVIKDLSAEFENAVLSLRAEAPACLKGNTNAHHRYMDDGTERHTYAYTDKTSEYNIEHRVKCVNLSAIEKTFDEIHNAFVSGVEVMLNGADYGTKLQWENDDQTVTHFRDAPHKSHVHVYSQENGAPTSIDGLMVPFHIDNGLYLLLTPSDIAGLQVKNIKGQTVDLSGLKANSVILMMGKAMSEWLLQDADEADSFAAVAHAVPSLPTNVQDRTVYARMRTAPMAAVPVQSVVNSNAKTFKDIFMGSADSISRRRRDNSLSRFVRSAIEECTDDIPEGEMGAQCWMGCQVVPEACTGATDLACQWDYQNGTIAQCKILETDVGLVHGMGCALTCGAIQDSTESMNMSTSDMATETGAHHDHGESSMSDMATETGTDGLWETSMSDMATETVHHTDTNEPSETEASTMDMHIH